MKQTLLSLILSFLFLIPCFAQDKISCPNIKFFSVKKTFVPGEEILFRISSGEELKELKLEYNWKISEGRIIEGQETPIILVSSAGLENITITATVEIKGLPQNCPNTFSGEAEILKRPTETPITDYEEPYGSELKNYLGSFYKELNNNPTAIGVIIIYGTSKEIAKREAEIKKNLKFSKYDSKRIKLIKVKSETGVRTRFFIVPAGEQMPIP